MENSNFNVHVFRGNSNKMDFNFTTNVKNSLFSSENSKKIYILKPLIKGALADLIQPILVDTGLNLFDICETISNNIVKICEDEYYPSLDVLTCALKNEVYTVTLTATAINKQELTAVINEAFDKIIYLGEDIYEVLSYNDKHQYDNSTLISANGIG